MNLDVEWAAFGFRNLRLREDFFQAKTPPSCAFVCRFHRGRRFVLDREAPLLGFVRRFLERDRQFLERRNRFFAWDSSPFEDENRV
jgi:hypothetical protein